MKIQIRKEALELLLRVLLSCQCPISDEEEKSIVELFFSLKKGQFLNYENILRELTSDTGTVFHRLYDFSCWNIPAISEVYSIERDHIIRHFASSYHWKYVVANGLSSSYKKVISVPSWFIGHMLIPVKLEDTKGSISGKYKFSGGEITMKNLFLPPEYVFSKYNSWAIHFASVICGISIEEESLIRRLNESTQYFNDFIRDISEIDYLKFERFKDYKSICENRHSKYFGNYRTA